MKQIPLSDLVAEKGQAFAAKALAVSPAAISKALSAGRNILISVTPDGDYEGLELKPFPAQIPQKKAAA